MNTGETILQAQLQNTGWAKILYQPAHERLPYVVLDGTGAVVSRHRDSLTAKATLAFLEEEREP